MEELNLIELLKDSPKGTKLYSPILGECELDEISKENELINVKAETGYYTFYKKGSYYRYFGECLLFPSKDNRDWASFKAKEESFQVGDHIMEKETGKVYLITEQEPKTSNFLGVSIIYFSQEEKLYLYQSKVNDYVKVKYFNPDWLKPFDKILVRDTTKSTWYISFFSHINKQNIIPIVTSDGCSYRYCIPYNRETKHLVGTSNIEYEFYQI